MSISHFTKTNFADYTAKEGYILIDFSADWCPPCKVMKPVFEHFAVDKDLSHLTFGEVDIDEEQELAATYQVSSIPTFVVLKTTVDSTGNKTTQEVKRWIGAQNNPLDFKMQLLDASK